MTLAYRSTNSGPLTSTQHDSNLDHFNDKTSSLISVADYGAVGDGTTDDTAAIQAAVDAAWAATTGGGSYRVHLPPGRYRITDSIRLFSNNGTSFDYTSFSFGGDARGYLTNRKTYIAPDFLDKPAIIVQAARGTKLSYFSIEGSANSKTLPTYADLLDDNSSPWWNTGGARDQRYSPFCGIAIDPFGSSSVGGNQYPGLDYYNKGNDGSTEVCIEEVECQGFIVGVAINTSEVTQLGDSITIRNCNLSYNRVACSVGQSQNRGVVLQDTHIKAAQVGVDTAIYGQGNGPLANVIGGVWIFIKWMVNGNSGWGQGSFKNLYVESSWSIGFWGVSSGGFPLTLADCHIKHIDPAEGGGKAVDCHLNAGGPVNFYGGYWGYYKNTYRRLSIYNAARVTFNGVSLDGEPAAQSRHLLSFNDVILRYTAGGMAYGISMSIDSISSNLPDNIDARVPPGGKVITEDPKEWSAGEWDAQGEGSVPFTNNGNGTGSFTSNNPGIWFVGAYVMPVTQWQGAGPVGLNAHTYKDMPIGRVTDINGSVISVNEVPISFSLTSFLPYYWRLPIIRGRSVCTTTVGSANLTNVNPTGRWVVGDRINGAGIPLGATIIAINGDTFTLNVNATASANSVGVYDALLRLSMSYQDAAPTTDCWFVGDRVYSKNPVAGGSIGWICVANGVPGTWKSFGTIEA